MVPELAEVLFAHPVQRRAVELGGAADVVVHLRLEGLAVGVVPGVRRDVAIVDEHVPGGPVLRLARQPVAALEQQDPLARGSEMARERAAARAAADDDHVVVAHPETSAIAPGSHFETSAIRSSFRSEELIRKLLDALGEDDPPGGLDQREVGEGLGEVAQVPAGARVELLGVQTERRGDAQELFHQVARALLLADDRQAGDQPEGADQEAALLAGQAVVGLSGAVAQDEAVLGQVVGDRQHARAQALVARRQEAEERRQQVGGVQRVGLVVLAQDPRRR